jgi:hypothetical protein
MAVFEYQTQVMFNMTVFDREPHCHFNSCFWYPNNTVFFFLEYHKQVIFQYDSFFKFEGKDHEALPHNESYF